MALQNDLRNEPNRAETTWLLDPTDESLRLSARRAADPAETESGGRTAWPDALCQEMGRLLLLALLEMNHWVLRRVEKVSFERDRSVTRRIDIDLKVRPDAPLCVDSDGGKYWLVPLAVLHRRTLVNLSLRDEDGRAVTTPGLRLTQQLDQSVLLAAAATGHTAATAAPHEERIRRLIQEFIAGERHDVFSAREGLRSAAPLATTRTFEWAFRRLERSYTVYVFLPVELGRHRLISMSFDEPTDWHYERSSLVPADEAEPAFGYRYEITGPQRATSLAQIPASLGLRPTRIRFQVPSAEAAASYHFEATAPRGVRIEQATIIAGRPNDLTHVASFDRVQGHSPTVGLHVVEVPNDSLCRVQLDLGLRTRGWLSIVTSLSWVVFVAIGLVALKVFPPGASSHEPLGPDQVTNIVLILVTTAAGAAALLTQGEFTGVAARLLSPMRALGFVAVTLPVVVAATLVAIQTPTVSPPTWAGAVVWLAVGLVLGIVLLVTSAWIRSRRAERRAPVRSPWDMTEPTSRRSAPRASFTDLTARYRFHSCAVGIRSVEAWREHYRWSHEAQAQVVRALHAVDRHTSLCAKGRAECRDTERCLGEAVSQDPRGCRAGSSADAMAARPTQ